MGRDISRQLADVAARDIIQGQCFVLEKEIIVRARSVVCVTSQVSGTF